MSISNVRKSFYGDKEIYFVFGYCERLDIIGKITKGIQEKVDEKI